MELDDPMANQVCRCKLKWLLFLRQERHEIVGNAPYQRCGVETMGGTSIHQSVGVGLGCEVAQSCWRLLGVVPAVCKSERRRHITG